MKGRIVALDLFPGPSSRRPCRRWRLEDFLVDAPEDGPVPGAIYRGIVDRPMKGQGGLFVKLGDATGFLRQISGLAPGQPVLVQVSGTAEPGKAVPVSARLLFKSRYAIVTPEAPGLNVSRRLRDPEQRAALERLAAGAWRVPRPIWG